MGLEWNTRLVGDGILQAMPRIDDGPTDGPPGRSIRTACVTLTSSEAHELLEALSLWAEEA
jgi:hypothetical protein